MPNTNTPSSPLPHPNLPYSGNIPNASLSASSLRLQSERGFLFNRNRSKSVAQPDSPGAASDNSDGRGGVTPGGGNHYRGGVGSGPSGLSMAPGMLREGSTGAQTIGGGIQGWIPPVGFSAMPGPSSMVGMYGARPALQHRETAPSTPNRSMGGSYNKNHSYGQDSYSSSGRADSYSLSSDPYTHANPSSLSLLSNTTSVASTEDGMSLPPLPPPPPMPINAHSSSKSSSSYTHSHSSSSGSINSAGVGGMPSVAASPRSNAAISGGGSQRTLQNMSRGASGAVYQSGSSSTFSSSSHSLSQHASGPFRGHAVKGSTGSGSGSSSGKGKARQLSGDGHDLPALPSSVEADDTPSSSTLPTPTPGGVSTFPARRVHHSKGSSGQIPEDTFEHDNDQDRSGLSNPMNASLNAKYILAEIGRSRDDGDTIDLGKKGIERVDSGDVAMLAKVGNRKRGVWRMALCYNKLTEHSLDRSFTQLSRLRYLNLKGNRLTAVPPALLNMPGLQILDLSKNQITALPEEPGRLVQLSVLSLTANRMTRLPGYLVYFANLRVLKVEQNPLIWPPPEVLKAPVEGQTGMSSDDRRHQSQGSGGDMLNQATGSKKEGEEDMRVWIATIKDWMRDHEHEQTRLLSESMNRNQADGLPPFRIAASSPPTSSRGNEGANQLPHFKMPLSASPVQGPTLLPASDATSVTPFASIKTRRRAYTTLGDRVPELDMSSFSNPSVSSLDTSEPSSASSQAPFAPDTRVTLVREPSTSSTIRDSRYGLQHSKSSSLTADQRLSSSSLASKKSLPDLRQDHAKIMADRRSVESGSSSQRDSLNPGLGIGIPSRRLAPPDSPARSLSVKGSISNLHAVVEEDGYLSKPHSRAPSLEQANGGSRDGRLAIRSASDKDPQHGVSRSSVDVKDAYFRRLSTLPPTGKLDPGALERFVESVRGLLFAFSQVNSALRQYTRYGMTDRVAAIFHRAVEPMSGMISGMIGTLDKFDAASQRQRPAINEIRQVVEAANHGVMAFAKLVTVLQQQVTALAGAAEHRYTRSFLLAVYGSLGEISASWGTMSKTLPDVRRAMSQDGGETRSTRHTRQPSHISASTSASGPTSPPRDRAEHRQRGAKTSISSLDSLHPKTSPSVRQVVASQQRAKRNAGSFSAEDVQTGMMLGPDLPPRLEDIIPLARMPSVSLEEVQEEDEERLRDSMNATPVAIKSASQNVANGSLSSPHKTPLSGKHGVTNSAGSSLGSITALRMGLREAASDFKVFSTRASEDSLLDVLDQTSEMAYNVWLTLSEEIGDPPSSSGASTSKFSALKPLRLPDISPKHLMQSNGQRSKRVHDLGAELGRAEETTRRLRERLMRHRADPGGAAAEDDADLVGEAEAFIAAVHHISELVTAISKEKSLSHSTRSSLNRLMAKARECNQVLPVSGLPRLPDLFAARAASPAFNGSQGGFQASEVTTLSGGASSAGQAKSSLPAAMSGGVAALRQAMPARSRSANMLPQLGMSASNRRMG